MSGTSANNASVMPVLRNVSLDIMQGEILTIVGSSGAGKSTLLHLLGALDVPDEGTITLTYHLEMLPGEEPVYIKHEYWALTELGLAEMRNSMIGFIFQFHHLLPEFTALENVMMPLLIAGKGQTEAKQRANTLLEQVGLRERMHHKPDALSGGEQQRVAFARAVANNPVLVFADEPTGNLDAANSAMLLDLMQTFRKEQGTTFVLVTHSAELAQAADRCLHLRAGVFVEVV
jgi:lipoprotein-releasing system ATP-binding protein